MGESGERREKNVVPVKIRIMRRVRYYDYHDHVFRPQHNIVRRKRRREERSAMRAPERVNQFARPQLCKSHVVQMHQNCAALLTYSFQKNKKFIFCRAIFFIMK